MKTHQLFSASVLIKTIISIAGFLVASSVTAQADQMPPDHQGWYQVEMIIFSRNNPSIQEYFPTNIPLHYPSHWQVLRDTNTMPSTPSDPLNLFKSSNTDESLQVDTNIDLINQAFYQLPEDMRQLNNQANKLSRSSEYSVLFHQAWRQPIVNKTQAEWILIKSNPQNEHSPILAGSIRLSVATYLRLDTNLWFAEFEPKLDDSENLWPELPDSPDLPVAETNADAVFSTELIRDDIQNHNELMSPQWQTKRIVLLKSKREMRSKEVHYIDHPILGILITISPITQ